MSFRIKNKRTGFVAKYNALTKKECEDFILFVLEERPTEIKTFLWEDFKLADVEIFEEEVEEIDTSLKLRLIEKNHQEVKTMPLDDEDRYSATVDVLTGRVFDLWQVWHLDDLGREEIIHTGTKEACERVMSFWQEEEE